MTSAKGFTLLEIVIALTLLGLVLVPTLGVFSTGLRMNDAAERVGLASLQAQSKLASVGRELPLVEGETSGTFEGGGRWSLRISKEAEFAPSASFGGPKALFRIDVSVVPQSPRDASPVTLTTMRVASADGAIP